MAFLDLYDFFAKHLLKTDPEPSFWKFQSSDLQGK